MDDIISPSVAVGRASNVKVVAEGTSVEVVGSKLVGLGQM